MGAWGLQVGRDSEREHLAAVLRDSASGHPGAVLVSGEAGIGKTSLVAAMTSGPAASGHGVLWGRCLRFGADSSPYLPIGQILTQWHREAEESERRRVLAGAEHLATIAPALGAASGPADNTRVLPLVATVLDRIAATVPLVLVVDDAQWADGTSLDLLAYLVAGFGAGQRLCLMVTYRDTDLGEGHRLHGWLADATRLPSVSRLRLERLDFADAEELVVRLRGGEQSTRFAAEVFDKAGGNPYYTELLVRGSLSGSGPDADLQQALLSSWHRLGPDARELLQLLALGGRPVAVNVLERLVAARGGASQRVASALTDSTAAGLTTVGFDGAAWFHHPLVAEVVATTLTPTSRERVHREYVEVLESSADLPMASRAAHLALHHAGAGDLDRAFSWSLQAADEAAAVRGYAEVCDHLHRACRLWEDVSEEVRATAGDRPDLWQRASEAAWSAGEHLLAVRLREEAIAALDVDVDPTRYVRLRLPLFFMRELCGLEPGPLSVETARAVADFAAERCPGTAERAQALARLALMEFWDGQRAAARQHATTGVRIARRIGSPEALAWTLCMRSQARGSTTTALDDVLLAVELAQEVGDPLLMGVTALAGANCLGSRGQHAGAADLLLRTFRRLLATRSVHDAMWASPESAVELLINIGRWDEARGVLRELLSRRHNPEQGAEIRGAAALLAFRTGDAEAGRTHLARARELVPGPWRLGRGLVYLEVEALWACGQLREALTCVERLMADLTAIDPGSADELMAVAARVAGDLAELPGRRGEAINILERLEQLRGPGPFAPVYPDDLLHPALGRLYAAERGRCHGDPDTATLWRSAVPACAAAGLAWDEARASYQLARSLLSRRGSRREAASALRHAARIATDLGAAPILADVETLAVHSRIPLKDPTPAGSDSGTSDALSSLTPREREVLPHLVAGRTYAEIAQALFISEKTVSVHVSNLLRKTGTTSRIELADLARRISDLPDA